MRISTLSTGFSVLVMMMGTVVHSEVLDRVQLDQQTPQEVVIKKAQGFAMLVWNQDLKKWIEVFTGAGKYQIGEVAEGTFADITNGDYVWSWDGARYVPRIPRNEIPKLAPISQEVADAVSAATKVSVTTATGAVFYDDADGSRVQFVVLDQNYETCAMGGTVCGGIVVRDGKPGADLGAAVGYGFRIALDANDAGHRYIEQGVIDGIIVQDVDSAAVIRRVDPAPVKISDEQPDPPDGVTVQE